MRGSNPENKLERMDIPIPIPNSSSIRMKKKENKKRKLQDMSVQRS